MAKEVRETVLATLMLAALAEEERTGTPRLYGTMWDLAQRVGTTSANVSQALRHSRTPEWIEANGYSFPSLGAGRSGAIHGYVLEYNRAGIELAQEQLAAHAFRLLTTLRSLTAQYTLAGDIVDGRSTTARKIGMALKAVDLAADALEVGLEAR